MRVSILGGTEEVVCIFCQYYSFCFVYQMEDSSGTLRQFFKTRWHLTEEVGITDNYFWIEKIRWLGTSMAPILSFVEFVAVGKEIFSSMSALWEQFSPLVQKCCVLWRFWFRYFMLEEYSAFISSTNIAYWHSCFQWVASVCNFPFDFWGRVTGVCFDQFPIFSWESGPLKLWKFQGSGHIFAILAL